MVLDHLHPGRKQLFVMYCEKHTPPLRLRRYLETKERREQDDIEKFIKYIDKTHHLMKTAEKAAADPYFKSVIGGPLPLHEAEKLSKKKQLELEFLQQIEDVRKKLSEKKYFINLAAIPSNSDKSVAYQVIDVEEIEENYMDKELTPTDKLWSYIRYKWYTNEQKFARYKRLKRLLSDVPKKSSYQKKKERKAAKLLKPTGSPSGTLNCKITEQQGDNTSSNAETKSNKISL